MNAFISVLDYTPCFLDHMTFYIIFPPFGGNYLQKLPKSILTRLNFMALVYQ